MRFGVLRNIVMMNTPTQPTNNSIRWNSNGRHDWQRYLEIDEDYRSIEKGLVSIMSRTGTGKSMIPIKSIDIDREKGLNGMYIFVPCVDRNLVEQLATKYESYLRDNNPSLDRLEERRREIPLEIAACFSNIQLTMEDKMRNVEALNQELLRISSIPSAPTIEVVRYQDSVTIKLSYRDDSTFTIHIRHLNGACMSLEGLFDRLEENHSIYIDEFHKVQTQFGMLHGGNRYVHNKSALKTLPNAYDRHGFRLFSNICRERKVVIFSATLDDVICNELPCYIGEFNILNIVVNHPREAISNPIIHSSNRVDMINGIMEAYRSGTRSLSFCSSRNVLEKLKRSLVHFGGIPIEDIYTYCSKDPDAFDLERVRQTKINIFINKGTTGMDVDDIGLVNIFRELSDDGSSCRDRENECISNLATQVIGRIRDGGDVYWERTDIAKTTLYEVTQPNFGLPFTEEQSYKETLMRQLNSISSLSPFEKHHIRPFIYKYILDKEDTLTSTTGETILNKFDSSFERFGGPSLKRSLKRREPHQNYIQSYINFEALMIEIYRGTFCNSCGSHPPIGMFSVSNSVRYSMGIYI